MIAIFKRDFRSLFTNVIGWVFLSVLCAFFGLYFLIYNLVNGQPYLSYALSGLCPVILIVTPILCMRVFSEERKNKTDQLIFTAPVSPFKIVFGKFLSVAAVYTIAMIFIAFSPIVLELYGASALLQNYVALFGVYIFGLACIAISIFVSTLTKSQIITVILSFVILFVGYMMDGILALIIQEDNLLSKILNSLSLSKPMQNYLNGMFDIKGLVYYVLVVALFLFLAYCVIQKRRWTISKQVLARSLSRGASLVLAIVLAIAVNVAVTYIPDNYTQLDATATRVYTLSDEGKEFIKNYNNEATIYVLATESECDENLKKTLDEFSSNDKITVEYVDLTQNPMFASQYTSESLTPNSLIVVSGNAYKSVNFDDIYEYSMNQQSYSYDVTGYDGEGQIVSALQRVMNNTDTLICTLTGHDEMELGSNATSALTKGSFSMQSLNFLEADKVPDACRLLIINAPSKDLSKDDVDKINEYTARGGNVLFNIANVDSTARSIVSINDMPNYKGLLQSFSVNVMPGVVCEDSSGYYYKQNYALLPEVLESDVSNGIDGNKSVLLYSATAMDYTENNNYTITPLLQTSERAYIKANLDGSTSTSTEKVEGDETGKFNLGLEVTSSNGSTVVVYGCQYLFNDEMDSYVANRNSKLFVNTVTAMVGTGDDNSSNQIVIPAKSLKVSSIMVTGAAVVIYGIIWGLFIPLACLIIGIVIWAIRRKQ